MPEQWSDGLDCMALTRITQHKVVVSSVAPVKQQGEGNAKEAVETLSFLHFTVLLKLIRLVGRSFWCEQLNPNRQHTNDASQRERWRGGEER